MSFKKNISRRRFLSSAATGMSFIYLPGIGRVSTGKYLPESSDGYQGRLCYNENPLGPSPIALTAMQETSSLAHRYPEFFSESLDRQIAEHHDVPASNICIGAGATEIIRLIANAFLSPGEEMITAPATYYQMASDAHINGADVFYVPLDENYAFDLRAIPDAIGPKTRLISLVNPNNPTGTLINKTDMESFLKELPDKIVVVVDEAYHHYVQSPDYESCIRFVKEGLPVIVIRTFSKVHGLAGARIGYSVASSNYTGMISSSQLPATVSRLSQAAAEAALNDSLHIEKTVALNNEAKNLLKTGLSGLGINYISSETNFMMFDTCSDAESVAMELSSRGYQVRTGWGMPRHIRVSTGSKDEIQGFLNSLATIITPGAGQNEKPAQNYAINSVFPNPFNSRCIIKIKTFGDEKIKLTVYDTAGRKIRSLVNKHLKAGMHHIIWDGKNYSGTMVASGTYIINLVQGEFSESSKVTLVK